MKGLVALGLLLLLLLAGLQYKLWFGSSGQDEVAVLRAQVARQAAENRQLQARNDALAAEVADLKSGGTAVEERARSELGLVKPGETFYRVIDRQTAGPAAPAAPSPAVDESAP